MYLATKD